MERLCITKHVVATFPWGIVLVLIFELPRAPSVHLTVLAKLCTLACFFGGWWTKRKMTFLLEMRCRMTNDQQKNANFSWHFKFAINIFKRLWPRNEFLFWLVSLCIVIKRGWFEITSRQIRQTLNTGILFWNWVQLHLEIYWIVLQKFSVAV